MVVENLKRTKNCYVAQARMYMRVSLGCADTGRASGRGTGPSQKEQE